MAVTALGGSGGLLDGEVAELASCRPKEEQGSVRAYGANLGACMLL